MITCMQIPRKTVPFLQRGGKYAEVAANPPEERGVTEEGTSDLEATPTRCSPSGVRIGRFVIERRV